jgi:hypothetical protein
MGDAGTNMPIRSARQIKNNLMGHRIIRSKETGTIPREILEKKFEYTDFDEDDERTDKYMRRSARYNGPDSILWESDMPRRSAATNVGLLNLRLNGSLGTKADQNHSEMFLGFTGHDPRGTSDLPDHTIIADHMRMRGKEYVKSMPLDLAENTLDGGGLNYHKIENDKRRLFYPVKDRMRWFSTSLDNTPDYTPKAVTSRTHKMNMENANAELPINVLEDSYRAPDYTVQLSANFPSVGPSVSDHKLPVARYGDTRPYTHISPWDLYATHDRLDPAKMDQKIREEVNYTYRNKQYNMDPGLLSGILNKMSESDLRKYMDSKDAASVPRSLKQGDITRFVSEYTQAKVNTPKEKDTVRVSRPGVVTEIDRFESQMSDTKSRKRFNDYGDNPVNRNIEITRNHANVAALSMLQQSEKKKTGGVKDGLMLSLYKTAHMNTMNYALMSITNQVQQKAAYTSGIHGSEAVSYSSAPVVANISKLTNKSSLNMGDGDLADSVWKEGGNLPGRRTNGYLHDRDMSIEVYDKSIRDRTFDNIGDDGSFMAKGGKGSKSVMRASRAKNISNNFTKEHSNEISME